MRLILSVTHVLFIDFKHIVKYIIVAEILGGKSLLENSLA